jgi:hypothetical protein
MRMSHWHSGAGILWPRGDGTSAVSLGKISVNYLCVPFSEQFEQPVSIAQRVNGVLLVRRFDGTFKPGGYVWICKDLFERHTFSERLLFDPVLKQVVCLSLQRSQISNDL